MSFHPKFSAWQKHVTCSSFNSDLNGKKKKNSRKSHCGQMHCSCVRELFTKKNWIHQNFSNYTKNNAAHNSHQNKYKPSCAYTWFQPCRLMTYSHFEIKDIVIITVTMYWLPIQSVPTSHVPGIDSGSTRILTLSSTSLPAFCYRIIRHH